MTAVLWDLDDTLLDTLHARMLSLAHAHEKCLGSKTDPEALWRSHRGGSLEAMGKRLMGEADYMTFVNAYRDFYYKLDRQIQPQDLGEEVPGKAGNAKPQRGHVEGGVVQP